MRYPPDRKADTEQRILQFAARAFREGGSGHNGIGAVMKMAGLTKGGFYRHFRSKEDLYARAVDRAFDEMAEGMLNAARAAPPGQALKAMIERYLSLEHVQSPGTGCVISTLGAEFPRQSLPTRRRLNRSWMAYRERLVPFLPGATDEERREKFAIIFSSMAGFMTTARALVDDAARKHFLARAREFLLETFAT